LQQAKPEGQPQIPDAVGKRRHSRVEQKVPARGEVLACGKVTAALQAREKAVALFLNVVYRLNFDAPLVRSLLYCHAG